MSAALFLWTIFILSPVTNLPVTAMELSVLMYYQRRTSIALAVRPQYHKVSAHVFHPVGELRLFVFLFSAASGACERAKF
jgi:hypothetical protein